jgi:solute carrier family 25 protein 34/35
MQHGPAVELLVGSVAGPCACLVSNPLEVIKSRLQVQGERGHSVRVGGMLEIGHTIVSREGPLALQRGLGPACAFNCVLNSVRFGTYDQLLRVAGESRYSPSQGGSSDLGSSDLTRIACGATSGWIAGFLSSPFAVLKTRSQIRSVPWGVGSGRVTGQSLGFQHHQSTSLLGGLRNLPWRSGLIQMAHTQAIRVASATSVQFWLFDRCKNAGAGPVASSLAAMVLCTLVMNPFDVACTRLYNQPSGGGGAAWYGGIGDCLAQTVRLEGPRGLFKGCVTHMIRQIPHGCIMLVLGDAFRMQIVS